MYLYHFYICVFYFLGQFVCLTVLVLAEIIITKFTIDDGNFYKFLKCSSTVIWFVIYYVDVGKGREKGRLWVTEGEG